MGSIYIPNAGSHNIYHFLIYMISTLEKVSIPINNIYIDMSNSYFEKNHNFVIEILSILYPQSKVYNINNPPPNVYILAKHTLTDFDNDKEKYHNTYKYLTSIFIPHIEKYIINNKYSKRIYISRDDSIYRKVLNEFEIMNHLEPQGFQKITLTGLPLLEQMAIFYNAEVIISVHGAALVNTLFCKKGTRVIELNTEFLSTKKHFEDIAEYCNLNYSRYKNTTSVHNHDLMANNLIINDIESLYSII